MPMKSKFSSDDIVEAAFAIARDEGAEKFSARAIAHKLNSSTMPIYSCHNSMKELEEAVLKKGTDLLISYATKDRTGNVFLDMGIGYIMFAKTERHLFRMMFLSEETEGRMDMRKRLKEYVTGTLLERLRDFGPLRDFTEDQKKGLIDRMWIINHGLAMLLNNAIIADLDEKQIAEMLLDVGIFLTMGELSRSSIYDDKDVKKFLTKSGFGYLSEQKGVSFKLF